MEKNKELIKEYQNVRVEREKLEENLKSLQASFAESEEYLSTAERELKEAEMAENSDFLITIKDVETARKKITNAKTKVDTALVVNGNLEKSIQKSSGSIQSINNRELSVAKRIFMQHSEVLLEEIKEIAGQQIDQYIVSLAISHPETVPHPLPGNLGEILKQPERMKSLRESMREELLN